MLRRSEKRKINTFHGRRASLTFMTLVIGAVTPQISLAESYRCHFVQQCAMPDGGCGLASRRVVFSGSQILGEFPGEGGKVFQVDSVGSVFIQENGQSALVQFASGKIPETTAYSGVCQINED